jgi:Raf kinase inhibitor-like YbhB/YbcL family protein
MTIVINKTLTIKSPAFANNDFIPSKYTCDGSNINPELNVKDIPADTRSLALIMDDPDAPKGTFDHWIMWNIPVKDKIEENTSPGAQGKNGKGENRYTGPCPPSGTHHYHFKIYALDTKLDLPVSTDKQALLSAIEGHILASGELIGVYKNKTEK